MKSIYNEMILILDFGSQYSQLIARRIRELGVYSEIKPYNYSIDKIKKLELKGIILSGGPSSVYSKDAPKCDKNIFNLEVPILAICYGMQLTAEFLNGKVIPSKKAEYGKTEFYPDQNNPLFKTLPNKLNVWMSHGDYIEKMPQSFNITGKSDNCPYASIYSKEKNIFGLQFHPEVTHTEYGKEILKNYVYDICFCQKLWSMESFIEKTIRDIKEQVKDDHVICGLSGGVDSSVVAVMLHKAIKDQLTCVFVDNGLLRKKERDKVEEIFKQNYKINLEVIDSSDEFLKNLNGITDPEQKRKIIGHTFINVFENSAKKYKNVKFLAQGTLYPDVIESVSPKGGPSATIKSHHNVGGLPERLNFKLIEPLRELFKDEVRIVGKLLGLPDEIILRQPFPGPGLAVRIIGKISEERCDILREADVIVLEEIKKANLYHEIWQSFAILLPLKTVGVMGDDRTYENIIAIRAVNSFDGMTADWVKLPYELLAVISNRIINEVKGVNRVVYDISSKPPATIEWE